MEKEEKKIEIRASVQKCFDTICDYKSYPEWQKDVVSTEILDYENGKPVLVELTVDAILKKVTYSLNYTYEDEKEDRKGLFWTYAGGEFKNIEGSYVFEKKDENLTLATYNLTVDIGFWAPKFILKTFKESKMQESLDAFKIRAEENNGG